MQPHSMCALSLAGWMWNSPNQVTANRCEMRVEYTKRGSYASHSYELSNIQESPDRREIRVSIMRSGGGLACTMTIRRNSVLEGSEITMTHDTIHVSGLREVCNLYKLRAVGGMSYNSEMYKGFAGDWQTTDWKRLDLTCEVKRDDGYFVPVRYQIERL